MALSFEDVDGHRGFVTESLEVRYDGAWEDHVTEYVERVEHAYQSGDGEFRRADVYSQLVVEIPTVAPIVEVERTEHPYAKA